MNCSRYLSTIMLTAFLMLPFLGCNNGERSGMDGDTMDGTQRPSTKDSVEKTKAFVLPNPMQVPTILKSWEVSVKDEMLIPEKDKEPHPTTKEKALFLGGLIADIGYAGIHRNEDRVLSYLKTAKRLVSELYLNNSLDKGWLKRFKSHLGYPDSLSRDVLSFYKEVHDDLRENEQEKVGLWVVSGVCIEGTFLLSHARIPQGKKGSFLKIFEQQSLFLSNLVALLKEPSIKANGKVASDLSTLKKRLDAMKEEKTSIAKVRKETSKAREKWLGVPSGK